MTIAEAVFDGLPVAVYAIDDDRFVYVNTKFAETLGYTKKEILDLESAVDIIPGGQKRKIVSEILRRRAAGTLSEFRYITTARCRDGTLLDAEIHGSVAGIDSGRIAIGAAVQVGPHLEVWRKLNEREQYFRALTEGISDVIFILDPLGTVMHVSRSVQEHLIDAVHPDDRERFSRAQVLVNLVLNARDAIAKTRGTLTIATSLEGDAVHFKVTDTGEGIPPENMDRLFEPLFTTKKKGSGLGLSVVHQIVTAHGGRIFVESEVGKGTTFDIGIPVRQ